MTGEGGRGSQIQRLGKAPLRKANKNIKIRSPQVFLISWALEFSGSETHQSQHETTRERRRALQTCPEPISPSRTNLESITRGLDWQDVAYIEATDTTSGAHQMLHKTLFSQQGNTVNFAHGSPSISWALWRPSHYGKTKSNRQGPHVQKTQVAGRARVPAKTHERLPKQLLTTSAHV